MADGDSDLLWAYKAFSVASSVKVRKPEENIKDYKSFKVIAANCKYFEYFNQVVDLKDVVIPKACQ